MTGQVHENGDEMATLSAAGNTNGAIAAIAAPRIVSAPDKGPGPGVGTVLPLALGGAAGMAALGAALTRGKAASPWLLQGALLLGGVALIAGLWYLSQGSPRSYVVKLSSEPDYAGAGADTPAEVYKLARSHFDAHDDAILVALDDMKAHGVVKSYEAFPIANSFIVSVNGHKQGEFRSRMQAIPDVGSIEQEILNVGTTERAM